MQNPQKSLGGLVALVWLACAVVAQAAVIDGTVLEGQAGRPLARARVNLMPISAGGTQTTSSPIPAEDSPSRRRPGLMYSM